jgi:hypothetical protein
MPGLKKTKRKNSEQRRIMFFTELIHDKNIQPSIIFPASRYLVQILHPQRNFQNSTCLFLNISDMTKNKVITGLKNEIRNYEKFKADELRTS